MFQPPRGTQDFLPEEMNKRNWIMDKVREVFESYGFEPLGTPAFENWDLLKVKSGEDVIKQIYYFKFYYARNNYVSSTYCWRSFNLLSFIHQNVYK